MAFEITNLGNRPTAEAIGVSLSSAIVQIADLTIHDGTNATYATGIIDTGIVGNKFIRGRMMVKDGVLTNGETLSNLRVWVDNAAAMTTPEMVAQCPTLTWSTGDTNMLWDFSGWSNTGFRYVKFMGTPTGATDDVLVDIFFEVF
jgi:hypothetical protein